LSKQRGSESDDKEEDEVKKLMMISESHDRSSNHSNNDLDPITVS
jgi:hypothetical protein